MIAATDLAGFWAGCLVRGSNTLPVFVNVRIHGDEITGSYEMPIPNGGYLTGKFNGTLSDDTLTVGLPGQDPQKSVQYGLRVVQHEDQYMLFGHMVLGTGFPRLATATLYKTESLYSGVKGIWPPNVA